MMAAWGNNWLASPQRAGGLVGGLVSRWGAAALCPCHLACVFVSCMPLLLVCCALSEIPSAAPSAHRSPGRAVATAKPGPPLSARARTA